MSWNLKRKIFIIWHCQSINFCWKHQKATYHNCELFINNKSCRSTSWGKKSEASSFAEKKLWFSKNFALSAFRLLKFALPRIWPTILLLNGVLQMKNCWVTPWWKKYKQLLWKEWSFIIGTTKTNTHYSENSAYQVSIAGNQSNYLNSSNFLQVEKCQGITLLMKCSKYIWRKPCMVFKKIQISLQFRTILAQIFSHARYHYLKFQNLKSFFIQNFLSQTVIGQLPMVALKINRTWLPKRIIDWYKY